MAAVPQDRVEHVEIVGAGMAGLTTAAILTDHGIPVTVHERADGPPTTGTVFGLFRPARDALDRLGVLDAVRAASTEQRSGAIRAPDGRTLVAASVPPTPLVTRPTLVRILTDRLPAGTVRYGRTGPESRRDGAADTTGTVVVAADGTFSRTREAAFGPDARPRPTGTTVWRGWVSAPTDRPVSTSETWGRRALFGITPRVDGMVNWFAALRAAPGSTSLEDLFASFGTWHEDVRHVLGKVAAEPGAATTVLHHDLYQSPHLASYVRGRVVLTGDAAHTMTPHLGRGAGEALVDGVTLGSLLAAHPAAEALRRYDRQRRRRTRPALRGSALVGHVALADRAAPVRDAALTVVGRLVPR